MQKLPNETEEVLQLGNFSFWTVPGAQFRQVSNLWSFFFISQQNPTEKSQNCYFHSQKHALKHKHKVYVFKMSNCPLGTLFCLPYAEKPHVFVESKSEGKLGFDLFEFPQKTNVRGPSEASNTATHCSF